MADPEQIYAEVLAEEQGKGVTPAVAEGRAKAARARAEHGSPHPKEPKWWPGAQPHLEGGGAPEEAADEAVEEPAAEEATADVQAEEVEQDAPAAAPEPGTDQPVAPAAAGTEAPAAGTEAPAAPAPAPQAVPQEPAAAVGRPAAPTHAPAEQPAAAATATQVVVPKTTGVSHGTTTGTRLRPEDEVATDAQFEGQKAMYERRKLIDDLVATGVPQVTAYETDRSRGPWLAVLYLLIPLLVVFYLATQEEEPTTEATADTQTEAPQNGGGSGPTTEITASGIEWDTDQITLTADEVNELDVINEDSALHNLSIYETEEDAQSQSNPLFDGPDVPGGDTVTYEIDPLKKGEYAFICDYHVNMQGTATVE